MKNSIQNVSQRESSTAGLEGRYTRECSNGQVRAIAPHAYIHGTDMASACCPLLVLMNKSHSECTYVERQVSWYLRDFHVRLSINADRV